MLGVDLKQVVKLGNRSFLLRESAFEPSVISRTAVRTWRFQELGNGEKVTQKALGIGGAF